MAVLFYCVYGGYEKSAAVFSKRNGRSIYVSSSGCTKNRAVTFAPPAGLFSICSEPPCFSQRERQMYSPRPKCSYPWGERDLSAR